MLKLFISYRRKSWPFAKKLADDLRQLLNAEIFIDFASIDETDFESSILHNLRGSDAVLVIVTEHTFAERIHRDNDWVRREIYEALRLDKPIVLACVDGLLPPDDLPEDIKAISRKEGTRFFPEYVDAGVEQLAAFIDRATPIKLRPPTPARQPISTQITTPLVSPDPTAPEPAPKRLGSLVIGAILLVALIGVLAVFFSRGGQNASQTMTPTASAQAVAMIATEPASLPPSTLTPILSPTDTASVTPTASLVVTSAPTNTATFTPPPTLTVTPLPTRTFPPASVAPTLAFTATQGGGILFQDTFKDNAYNWDVHQDKLGVVALADGALTIKTLQPEQAVWTYPAVALPSDVDVSVTAQAIRPDRNKDWFYGLGIRGRTVGRSIEFYYFKVCGFGNWEFGIAKAGVLTYIAGDDLREFNEAAPITLRIRAVRNRLEFYINGDRVWTADDIKLDTVKSNQIVLIGGTHVNTFSQLVRFTKLRVLAPENGR